ncbi:hypothetical protein [Kitasatospora sp. KL5]|uniref:hypothetical protein n=1 Tax=Kitasatospora sp. KL5 TaxID=3425125 RepID=UPI003D6F8565
MHFSVIVALPPTARDDVAKALVAALGPFDENREVEAYREYLTGAPAGIGCIAALRRSGLLPAGDDLTWQEAADAHNRHFGTEPGSEGALHVDGEGRAYFLSTCNPDAKWDGWVVGGRWPDHFVHRPDAAGDPRLIVDHQEGTGGTLRCDGGPRALLDFEAMRDLEEREAAARHDRWTELVGGLPAAQPWRHFLARHLADPDGYPMEQARDDHRTQARCRAAHDSEEFRYWDGGFSTGRAEYVARARAEAVPNYALLRLDGTWTEPGSDTEEDRAAYAREANAYLDALDGGTLLVTVDCHC